MLVVADRLSLLGRNSDLVRVSRWPRRIEGPRAIVIGRPGNGGEVRVFGAVGAERRDELPNAGAASLSRDLETVFVIRFVDPGERDSAPFGRRLRGSG